MKQQACTIVILLTTFLAGLGIPARADYQAGVDAYYRGDFKAALAEWLPLAESGDAIAENSVGALYDHGLGVEEDDAAAAHWYQLAAEQNLPLAMRNLANMYAGGHGVPYDKALAESWYEKAARLGDAVALKRMAALEPTSEFAAAVAAEPVTAAGGSQPVQAAAAPAAEPMTVAGETQSAEATPAPEAPTPEAPAQETPVPEASAPEASAPAPAPAPEQMVTSATDSDQAPQYGETGAVAPAADASSPPSPTTTQQAALTPPPAPSDSNNWLIGMWKGPSLGCPPGGGMEFAEGETRSYYGGQIAARLPAKYKVEGDHITVVSTSIDGVGHSYEYERKGPDAFVITAVPTDMPQSMIGIEHHRCASAPLAAAAAPAASSKPAAAPAPAPVPAAPPKTAQAEPTAKPFVPAPVEQPKTTKAEPGAKPFVPAETAGATQPAPKAVPVTPVVEAAQPQPIAGADQVAAKPQGAAAGTPQAGWDAFGRGDYQGALAVWQPLAEQGDVPMQLLVGSIYDYGQGVPQNHAEAVKWYQMAAERGSAKGQYQLGAIYARSPQIRNPVEGYKWLTIAARNLANGPQGGITADQATTLRTLLSGQMSKEEIAKAKEEADAFKATKE
ncbi:MAG: hypothetical protein R3D05_02005 [Dongiaceae bacterium]